MSALDGQIRRELGTGTTVHVTGPAGTTNGPAQCAGPFVLVAARPSRMGEPPG